MKRGSKKRKGIGEAGVVLGLVGGWLLTAAPAMAEGPPLEFGLQAVGAEAQERREGSWRGELVSEGGIESLSEGEGGDSKRIFEGGRARVEISAESEGPWRYVWAILWSEEPEKSLAGRWGRGAATVESIGGEIGFCYGQGERICLDEELRRILYLRVQEEGKVWEFRSTQGGRALRVSLDGGLYGRFRGD